MKSGGKRKGEGEDRKRVGEERTGEAEGRSKM